MSCNMKIKWLSVNKLWNPITANKNCISIEMKANKAFWLEGFLFNEGYLHLDQILKSCNFSWKLLHVICSHNIIFNIFNTQK